MSRSEYVDAASEPMNAAIREAAERNRGRAVVQEQEPDLAVAGRRAALDAAMVALAEAHASGDEEQIAAADRAIEDLLDAVREEGAQSVEQQQQQQQNRANFQPGARPPGASSETPEAAFGNWIREHRFGGGQTEG